MRVAIGIQCRFNSRRLKGKAVELLNGNTLLHILITRMKRVGVPVYVLTATDESCNVIADIARNAGVGVVKGEEEDVWGRYAAIIQAEELDAVVRVTGDNPLTSISMIRCLLAETNRLGVVTQDKGTVPQGLKGELVDASLFKDKRRIISSEEREHVTIREIEDGNVLLLRANFGEYMSEDRLELILKKSFSVDTRSELAALSHFFEAIDAETARDVLEGAKDIEDCLSSLDLDIIKHLPDRTDWY